MLARHTPAIVLLIGLIAVSHAFAEYYRYRDKNGVLRFTDNLAEVPADQRPEMKRYKETKTPPPAVEKRVSGKRKQGRERSTGKARKKTGEPQNKAQTQTQWLIQEQRELDKTYRKLMNEKMDLANESRHIKTAEEAKAYRRKLNNLNERIAKFEKRRYTYLNRSRNLKEQIEKEKQRQNHPGNAAATAGPCADPRRCGQQSDQKQ